MGLNYNLDNRMDSNGLSSEQSVAKARTICEKRPQDSSSTTGHSKQASKKGGSRHKRFNKECTNKQTKDYRAGNSETGSPPPRASSLCLSRIKQRMSCMEVRISPCSAQNSWSSGTLEQTKTAKYNNNYTPSGQNRYDMAPEPRDRGM